MTDGAGSGAAPAVTAPEVRTSRGRLRGQVGDGWTAFKGIPYAAPPVAERRFRAPVPAAAWDGVRDATEFGPIAPQAARSLPGLEVRPLVGDGWGGGDEFLNLNVWTPDSGTGGLPVMVWLHGGAFVAGSSALPIYDGSAFARDGVVLVSANYRMGVEGFLPLAGGQANCGLHDQVAVLRWVAEEISAFGGDPGNVTVFGESAGAISIDLLLGSPAARGLFRRAISQSGGAWLTRSSGQGERTAATFAERLGVAATRDGLASVGFDRTVDVQAQILPLHIDFAATGEPDRAAGLAVFLPLRGDELVAAEPLAAIREGAGADVALLLGDNQEEANLYLAGAPGFDSLPEAAAQGMAAANHPDPEALLGAYRASRPGISAGELASAVMTDAAFHLPTVRLAEARAAGGASATWAYEFAWRSGGLGGRLGACHGLDVPFVFDTLDAPLLRGENALLGPEGGPAELAERMHAAWVRFAKTGDPGWSPWEPEERRVMRIGHPDWEEIADPRAAEREAWAGVQ